MSRAMEAVRAPRRGHKPLSGEEREIKTKNSPKAAPAARAPFVAGSVTSCWGGGECAAVGADQDHREEGDDHTNQDEGARSFAEGNPGQDGNGCGGDSGQRRHDAHRAGGEAAVEQDQTEAAGDPGACAPDD